MTSKEPDGLQTGDSWFWNFDFGQVIKVMIFFLPSKWTWVDYSKIVL